MKGKSRAMIDQIRAMRADGHSISKIKLALGISRNTVRRYLRDDEVDVQPAASTPSPIDWETILAEIGRGRVAKRLYEELSPTMSYSNFSRILKKKRPMAEKPIAIRLHHEPGEKTQVDYATGLMITDHRTGVQTPTQFFCGVLPHSSFIFGEFTMTQRLPDFIRSHERMWAYFGGVSQYVVLDNLKSGVSKAHRYDPDVNPTYCDYSNHAGFVALPARVRTPRDKAAVEATIGVIQRDFFDRNRDKKFYSLGELNQSFRKYLDELNLRLMPDYGCSRLERFESEKDKLKPLSERPYEFFEWKKAKVHPDSCIELSRSVYSVPFEYVHQTVHVKFSDKIVIVMNESATKTIAVHARQPRFKNSIIPSHLPPNKTQLSTFDVRRVQKFADGIGPRCREYIDWQFDGVDQPLRALRRMLGLLRFHETKRPSASAMEYAASLAKQFNRKDLRYFQNCATSHLQSGSRIHLVTPPKRETTNIHIRT
jgi:transposase